MISTTLTDQVRDILSAYARLATDVSSLADDSNLYDAGLSSHASVTVMLALEEHFNIEFPERMLRRGAFGSIRAIQSGLEELLGAAA